jgi:hypothetical protein
MRLRLALVAVLEIGPSAYAHQSFSEAASFTLNSLDAFHAPADANLYAITRDSIADTMVDPLQVFSTAHTPSLFGPCYGEASLVWFASGARVVSFKFRFFYSCQQLSGVCASAGPRCTHVQHTDTGISHSLVVAGVWSWNGCFAHCSCWALLVQTLQVVFTARIQNYFVIDPCRFLELVQYLTTSSEVQPPLSAAGLWIKWRSDNLLLKQVTPSPLCSPACFLILFQLKADALLHCEALALCASRSGGLPLIDRFSFIGASLALAVQFNDSASQGRALLAAACAHMDALEHSVFSEEGRVSAVDVPYFCSLPASAGDAMASACAAVALGCCALHNALCEGYNAREDLGSLALQAEYAEAVVLASLALKDAGAYASACSCAARAQDLCRQALSLQLKARCSISAGTSPRSLDDSVHVFILRNFKRIKFYCSSQLLHVTVAAIYAHACLLQDCSKPADAAHQFECCSSLFSFLALPSLQAACLLRAVECKASYHIKMKVVWVLCH